MRVRLAAVALPAFLLALAAAASVAAPAADVAGAGRKQLNAAADAYVRASRPRANFGRRGVLRARARPLERSFMRFAVRGFGPVAHASLHVFVGSSSRHGFRVRLVHSNRWKERRITHASAPRLGRVVASSGRVSRGWVAVDVTSAVRGDGVFTFALTAPGAAVTLASREARGRAPRLVVTAEDGAGGPGPAPPAPPPPSPPPPSPPGLPPPPVDPGCPRPYSDASPWNRPIGVAPLYHPQSAFHVTALEGLLTSDPTQYTYPVYPIAPGTPLQTVHLRGWYSNVTNDGQKLHNQRAGTAALPIPPGAQAAAGSDAQMILLDPASGDEYGLSELTKRTDGTWDAWNAYHYNTRWTGVPPYDQENRPFFARGAGVPYLAGLVRPCEIARGRIDHALAFAYNFPTAEFVYPATKSDGDSPGPPDMPEGAHLQLDPAMTQAELATLGCTGPCYTIARALQEYGMFIIDNSGRPKVMMEYEGTAKWGGIVNSKTPNPIPLARFRLLAFP